MKDECFNSSCFSWGTRVWSCPETPALISVMTDPCRCETHFHWPSLTETWKWTQTAWINRPIVSVVQIPYGQINSKKSFDGFLAGFLKRKHSLMSDVNITSVCISRTLIYSLCMKCECFTSSVTPSETPGLSGSRETRNHKHKRRIIFI